jgi:hypothetical protein
VSQTKAVHVLDRVMWVWDSSHDIVVARMVGAAEDLGFESASVDQWRVWASVADLALDVPDASAQDVALLLAVLAHWCTIQSFDTSRIAGALVHQ